MWQPFFERSVLSNVVDANQSATTNAEAKVLRDFSQFMTLQSFGDLICKGLPPGVGMVMKKNGQPAPMYRKRADVMTLDIEGLGEKRQAVGIFKA